MREITVVTIGPDAPEHLTLAAVEALEASRDRLLRTGQHGVARWLAGKGLPFETLDALYERAGDFDELNAQAVQAVLAAAGASDSFCYAVPDPASDATVDALRRQGASLRVIAGVTLESAARAAGLEAPEIPGGGPVVSLTALDFAGYRVDPSAGLLITEIHSVLDAGEIKIRLLDIYPPQTQVLFCGRVLPLEALDRQPHYDHLTYAYLPPSPAAARDRYTFGDLLDVMARLRKPGDGCPWDIEQTHETLRQYLIEEAYEVAEAIDRGDMDAIADELGDVLLQVVFHAQIAQEHGEFDITDITTHICHKMITRHAHIFGDVICNTPDEVIQSWEAIKKKEKGLLSTAQVMRGVSGALPALMRAAKVQQKARQVGFDWDDPRDALSKVREESGEVLADIEAGRDPEEEFGDLLFAVVNAARLAHVQPEVALSRATEKFIRRFERMEAAVGAQGKALEGMTLEEMDGYWNAVKGEERESP